MGTVGIFINLTQANETALRVRALTNWLPSGAVDPSNGIVYGGGAFSTNPQSYAKKAEKLIKDNPGAKLFIATCWPSVDALDKARQALGVSAPILYAGMVTPDSTAIPSQCTGIKAFDIGNLCPNWPALLLQIAPSMTKAAVVYDDGHLAPQSQYDAICTGPLKNITKILANNPDKSPKTDQDIEADISTFAQAAGAGAGLIVTACTFTGLLREAIARAARKNGLVTIYPAQMYTRRTSSLGLMSYGPDLLTLYAEAASGDAMRILSGTSANNIPRTTVLPPDYKLVISEKIAADLNLSIPAQFTVTFNGVQSKVMPVIDQ